MVPNLLLYTRKIASTYDLSVSTRNDYLIFEQSCPLAKLVMRLLLTCKKQIDYQGFIFEREESYSNFAEQMSGLLEHVVDVVPIKHFPLTR